ncbi:MAG: DsrE family protein [Gammaproteobacteria bacterium]|jgi:intracellular sulfur oxidation DsrE/DsrF family protein
MKSIAMNHRAFMLMLATLLLMFGAAQNAFAEGAKHKMVIQVSTDDARTQKIALNNAVNLQKLHGMDNVDIEIVAYGPGLGLLTPKNKQAKRVKSLALQNIKFSACENTMRKIEKKTGKKPKLTEGVGTVPAGVARILELQEQGYAYLRP